MNKFEDMPITDLLALIKYGKTLPQTETVLRILNAMKNVYTQRTGIPINQQMVLL